LIDSDRRLVIFDGYCNVCSSWARFLERHAVRPRFELVPMQSEVAKPA
jgi:predicted DCC family thiol-disulfide oxidoreductase YuxK